MWFFILLIVIVILKLIYYHILDNCRKLGVEGIGWKLKAVTFCAKTKQLFISSSIADEQVSILLKILFIIFDSLCVKILVFLYGDVFKIEQSVKKYSIFISFNSIHLFIAKICVLDKLLQDTNCLKSMLQLTVQAELIRRSTRKNSEEN